MLLTPCLESNCQLQSFALPMLHSENLLVGWLLQRWLGLCLTTYNHSNRKEKKMLKQNQNIEIELVKRMRIEGYEETRICSVESRNSGTVRYLGPDRQHGRHVYLCFGEEYGYFVSSREADGSLTCRTASLEQAGICPSRITLEAAIRLMDEIDADFLRKIAGSSRRRRDIVS